MKNPSKGNLRVIDLADRKGRVVAITGWKIDTVDSFLRPTEGYTVGSFEVKNAVGTLSSGVIALVVTNEPEGTQGVAPATAVTRNAAGMTAPFDIRSPFAGLAVTTTQSNCTVDAFLYLTKTHT